MAVDADGAALHDVRVPNQRPRVFYRIGEVARLVGVSPQVLRHWEEALGVPRPMKTAGSHRHYRRHDVELAMRVRSMLETEGLTLAGVKKRLATATTAPERSERAWLTALRAELEGLLDRAGAPTRPSRRPRIVPAGD